MVDYTGIKQFNREYPQKVTCRFCGDVRFYSHSCFYEDICPNCDSRAFDCRSVVRVKLSEVPEGTEVRTSWT